MSLSTPDNNVIQKLSIIVIMNTINGEKKTKKLSFHLIGLLLEEGTYPKKQYRFCSILFRIFSNGDFNLCLF